MTDSINGYRLIRKNLLRQLNQDAEGYNIEIQQTIRCLKLGRKIREIPTVELERVGPSKKSPTYKMGYQFMKVILNELLIGRGFLNK